MAAPNESIRMMFFLTYSMNASSKSRLLVASTNVGENWMSAFLSVQGNCALILTVSWVWLMLKKASWGSWAKLLTTTVMLNTMMIRYFILVYLEVGRRRTSEIPGYAGECVGNDIVVGACRIFGRHSLPSVGLIERT